MKKISLMLCLIMLVLKISALPISSLSFGGIKKTNSVLLNWRTAAEINSKEFQIERLDLNNKFVKIGTVKASGNSNRVLVYSFTDFDILVNQNVIFYRLKMVDLDGSYKYSNIIKISDDNDPETIKQNSLRIQLVKDSTERDETVIRFMENKSDECNANDDVLKYVMNANVNISSYYGKDKYVMVNYLSSYWVKNTKIIQLGAWVSKAGNYLMSFNQIEGFDDNISLYLKDNYNNTLTDLRVTNVFGFNVEEGNAASTADGRLEVIFVNTLFTTQVTDITKSKISFNVKDKKLLFNGYYELPYRVINNKGIVVSEGSNIYSEIDINHFVTGLYYLIINDNCYKFLIN